MDERERLLELEKQIETVTGAEKERIVEEANHLRGMLGTSDYGDRGIKNQEFFSSEDLLALTEEDMEDVWAEGIWMIRVIQEHHKHCEKYRFGFNTMEYKNFEEFEKILSVTPLHEWIYE